MLQSWYMIHLLSFGIKLLWFTSMFKNVLIELFLISWTVKIPSEVTWWWLQTGSASDKTWWATRYHSFVKTLHLPINMRVQKRASHTNDMFEKFVLDVGNGANQIVENGIILNFQKKFSWTQWRWTSTVDTFNEQDKSYFGRAILTTTNENVDKINKLVMDKLPDLLKNTRTYWSAHSVVMKNNKAYIPNWFSQPPNNFWNITTQTALENECSSNQ